MKNTFAIVSIIILLLVVVGLALFPATGEGLSGLSGKKDGYQWKKVMSGKEVWKQLENNGWVHVRWNGDHKIYEKKGESVSVPAHKELRIGTFHSIKKFINFVENK